MVLTSSFGEKNARGSPNFLLSSFICTFTSRLLCSGRSLPLYFTQNLTFSLKKIDFHLKHFNLVKKTNQGILPNSLEQSLSSKLMVFLLVLTEPVICITGLVLKITA